jgi:DNA-binding NtrC family response regulator
MNLDEQNRESRAKTNVEKIKEKYTEEEIREQIEAFGQEAKTMRDKIRVLYLDDEQDALDNFKSLYRRSFTVFITSSINEAKDIVANEHLHVILTDQRMPEMTGVEFLKSIKDKYPDPIRILVTGYSDVDAVIGAINEGQIYKYMPKPYPMEAMKQTIENAAEVYFLRKDKEDLLQKMARANSQLDFMLRQKLMS